jgi:hypothetical protein
MRSTEESSRNKACARPTFGRTESTLLSLTVCILCFINGEHVSFTPGFNRAENVSLFCKRLQLIAVLACSTAIRLLLPTRQSERHFVDFYELIKTAD